MYFLITKLTFKVNQTPVGVVLVTYISDKIITVNFVVIVI